MTAPTSPVDLTISEAGRGGRPLLLVHGFTGAKEDFGDWVEPLADEGWWVVAPDLRGHGESPKPDLESAYSLSAFASDLVALVDRLGWSGFHLLGHSMGGMVAQDLALSHGHRISALLLMNTHHGPVPGYDEALVDLGVELVRKEGIEGLMAALRALAPQEPTPSEIRVRARRPAYQDWCDAKLRAVSPAMYAALALELTRRPDRLRDLAKLAMPTRVIVGAEDRDFLEAAPRMAATIPRADLVSIPDAAHSPQFENPEGWWAAVAPFLAAHQPT